MWTWSPFLFLYCQASLAYRFKFFLPLHQYPKYYFSKPFCNNLISPFPSPQLCFASFVRFEELKVTTGCEFHFLIDPKALKKSIQVSRIGDSLEIRATGPTTANVQEPEFFDMFWRSKRTKNYVKKWKTFYDFEMTALLFSLKWNADRSRLTTKLYLRSGNKTGNFRQNGRLSEKYIPFP